MRSIDAANLILGNACLSGRDALFEQMGEIYLMERIFAQ